MDMVKHLIHNFDRGLELGYIQRCVIDDGNGRYVAFSGELWLAIATVKDSLTIAEQDAFDEHVNNWLDDVTPNDIWPDLAIHDHTVNGYTLRDQHRTYGSRPGEAMERAKFHGRRRAIAQAIQDDIDRGENV
jgi:hypothetical protein